VHLTWELYYSSALPPTRPIEISFWWWCFLKVMPTFKQVATCNFVQGTSILFCKDKWIAETLLETWPQLFFFFCKEWLNLFESSLWSL
jgi:hypothetical protein